MSEVLYDKYRPKTFDEVIGQSVVISSLKTVIEKKRSQTFLFCGPSGCGKTTLARITARAMGCLNKDIMEIPAAVYTGVEKMREVQEMAQYRPFGKGQGRAIIIDECHRLSGNAWDSLLKAIEEPSVFVSWYLCTTEMQKVPRTVKTRCATFTLKEVSDDNLRRLLQRVAKAESIQVPDGVVDLIIREAHGSPRELLSNLGQCENVKDKKQAAELLKTVLDSDTTLELCRFLIQGGSWIRAMGIISKLEEENPEGVRIVVCNYIGSVLKNARNDKEAVRLLQMLEAFSTPYNQSERVAPLLLSVGQVLFNG
jgi:DNA polymerase III subunit gamma/tau